jgi:hypothetical protein
MDSRKNRERRSLVTAGDIRTHIVSSSIAKKPYGPSWISTLIGVQCHEISRSSSLSRVLVQRGVHTSSSRHRTRLSPRSIVTLWLSSFILVAALEGTEYSLTPWKNIFGTVVPTSIWTHPPRIPVSEVACTFCRIDPAAADAILHLCRSIQ